MLPPYKLITGTDEDIEDFEQQIADALLAGYEFQGDLVTQKVDSGIHFFQAMTCDDSDADDDDYDPEDDDFEMDVEDD